MIQFTGTLWHYREPKDRKVILESRVHKESKEFQALKDHKGCKVHRASRATWVRWVHKD